MNEKQRYAGPIKVGMGFVFRGNDLIVRQIRGGNVLWTDKHGSDRGSTDIDILRESTMLRPVRPADDDAPAWERFLPDGPLPERDSSKDGRIPGRVWQVGDPRDYESLVIKETQGSDGVVLAGTSIFGVNAGGAISFVTSRRRYARLLFDAPWDTAGKTAPGCEAWCGLPYKDERVPSNLPVGGLPFGIADRDGAEQDDPAYCSAACLERTKANHPAVPESSPRREPVAPWVRLEKPGKAPWIDGDDTPWRCTTDAHGTFDAYDALRPLAMYGWDDPSDEDVDDGACEACAERAGVFGPVARLSATPLLLYPLNEAASGATPAGVTKPCPACNGIPFETKRCPRCSLASKAEPVRVRLAPVGACVGPLATHGTPVLRYHVSFKSFQTGEVRTEKRLLCDECYLGDERYFYRETHEGWSPATPVRPVSFEPPARIGTVPQSIGPGAGVGIWGSRGMR